MSPIARRFRGVLIAIVVLGLSASAVFAARALPQLAGAFSGGVTASQQQRSAADQDQNEAPADKDAPADEDATEDADAPADDPEAPDNHGAFVSEAAHMATPAGFRNHGAFVSCVAHVKDVPADTAAFLTALTPAACDRDEDATEDADAPADDPDASDNHGAFVSQAAHMATPAGFRNHGAFVSCVAHVKDVPADTAAFLAALTPAGCERDQADKHVSTSTDAVGPKKDKAPKVKNGHGRGHAKNHGS